MSADERKALIVVSDDHGELSNAVWLLLGRRFQAELLLTPRLFALNPDVLPAPARSYTSVQDVIDAAQRFRPDVVFLLSGYLYAANGIFDVGGTHELVESLRALPTRIVTSDPFLGLLAGVTLTIDAPDPDQQLMVRKLSAAGSALKDEYHIYPLLPHSPQPARRVSFFNSRMLVPKADRMALRNGLAIHLPLDTSRPRWLYVLAREDYAVQAALHGTDKFHALVVQRLEDAYRHGRQPVLVAPEACADAVRRTGHAIPGVLVLSFCSHGMFLGLLLEAEYAFYWNIFANSVPSRLVNRMPCFSSIPGTWRAPSRRCSISAWRATIRARNCRCSISTRRSIRKRSSFMRSRRPIRSRPLCSACGPARHPIRCWKRCWGPRSRR